MPDRYLNRLLRRIKIKYRIPIIVVLGISSCALTVALAVNYAARHHVEMEKQNTKNLVESARNLVSHFHSLTSEGALSEAEAKRQALEALKRAGLSDRSYVYIYNDQNFMVMHPHLPEQSLPDFTPADMERSRSISRAQLEQHRLRYALPERRRTPMEILFKHHPDSRAGFFNYALLVDEDGLGFMVELDDPHLPADTPHKIGYGSYFAPWGWIVLGGVYLGDVQVAVGRSLRELLPPLLIGMLLLGLASIIVSRSITQPIAEGMQHLQALISENRFVLPDLNQGDEFAQLSHAFDGLIEQLKERDDSLRRQSAQLAESNKQLTEHKQGLELAIEERTRAYKLARDEAEAATRAKSEFLATMSHELRTPMSGVIGIVDILKDTELDATQREYINIISSSGKQLLDLVGDILNYEKIAAGKLELESLPFNLRHVCQESLMPFQLRLHEKQGVDIRFSFADSCPEYLLGDALRIRQVLNNFLSNAFKFTATGAIDVTVKSVSHQGREFVHLAVQDTGIGINEENKSKLFCDYQQAERSTCRKYGGTGLGLSISKKIVELMGGSIGVDSQVGAGSTFWCEIPLVAASAPAASFSKATQVAACAQDLRVLVAEDNPVNQMVVKGYLHRLGIKAALVENGEMVLNYLRQHPVDLIFMDISMPLMDGLTAARRIREQENRPQDQRNGQRVAIYALTADASEQAADDYRTAGMDGVLTKPVQLESLAAALEQVLAQAGASGIHS